MANAITRIALSKKKKRMFLRILAQTGQVTEAAYAVGYTDTTTVLKFRREDEAFAEEWDNALEAAKHVLEAEAIRRAREGVLEPVYYKGDIVGYKTNYSDPLLMFVLRKLDPAYRDTGQRGDTNINFGIAVLPMTAKNDDEWEKRALEMHGNQQVITLEAKPQQNHLQKMTRSD